MPAPMPPQGAPGPQQPDSSPGAPPPDQGSDGGGAISTLLMNVGKALDHLNLVIGQSKATSPQEKQLIGQISAQYGQLTEALGMSGDGGGDEPPPGQGQGQTVPPEAAGNKGAIPAP